MFARTFPPHLDRLSLMPHWPEWGHIWPFQVQGKLGKPRIWIILTALRPVKTYLLGWPHWLPKNVRVC